MRISIKGIYLSRSERKLNNAQRFDRAMTWVQTHRSSEGGIRVSSINSSIYPEVTGYFIPTLLSWGEDSLALEFGNALLPIQQSDGSFLDPSGEAKCVFDTGQIIRGLLELSKISENPDFLKSLRLAVNWVASTVDDEGHVNAPDVAVWGGVIPIGVLLYSLEPALRAAQHLNLKTEQTQILKGIKTLLDDHKLTDFNSVSHFHAYILEALVDLGESHRAKDSLEKMLGRANFKSWIPGKPGKKWVCSTAMFQYALICYKLQMISEGDKLFLAAARLQNSSGGWYGSYGFTSKILAPAGRLSSRYSMYFPRTEIPWVNKYFFDSLKLRLESSFEVMSYIFSDEISPNDGRLKYVISQVANCKPARLLDLGCDKGRYIKHIMKQFPEIEIHACDMSEKVTSGILSPVIVSKGSLVRTPYESSQFDFVMTVEALEHAVNTSAAIRELDRILAPGGSLLIIDKNESKLGRLRLPDWERWFNARDLARDLESMGYQVQLVSNLEYEGRNDGLFFGLQGRKNG